MTRRERRPSWRDDRAWQAGILIGSALGAIVCQGMLPEAISSGVSGPLPSQGRDIELLRPACPSWIAGTAPCPRKKAAIRASSAICSSRHRPRSPCVILPSSRTAVASRNTMPAPPCANFPACTKCQSLANPSWAEYWHIGEITIRLREVMPRNCSGVKSWAPWGAWDMESDKLVSGVSILATKDCSRTW